jgi:similar to stage IV sporulation protein
MFLLHLWNYIRGYVIIVVTGRSIERFINICSKRQILLWDIARKDHESAVMKVSIRGFRLMRPAAKKSACKVHILKKCGLPFFLIRFWKRKGFKVGLIVFIALLSFFTSMIWEIEILGCKPEVTTEIMNVLKMEKIDVGCFKMGLNPKKIASDIIMKVDGIAWAGVQIKGVKLTVTVKDGIKVPKIIQNNEEYDIVAKRDGLVTKVEVYAGKAVVKEGETVRKGQLLISGRMESQFEFGIKDVHAMGKIIARTWYENSIPVSMEYSKKIKSGNTHETRYLKLLGLNIKLPGAGLTFENYQTTYHENFLSVLGLKLPIGLTVEKSFEIIDKKVALTEEEAMSIAEETARYELIERIPDQCEIIEEKVNYFEGENGKKYIQVVFECEEDIASLKPMTDFFIDNEEDLYHTEMNQ